MVNGSANRSLLSQIKFLFNDTIIYGSGIVVNKFLAIFTVPILTRVFSKELFGVVDAIGILGMLIIPLAVMGQDSAIARYYYDEDDALSQNNVVTQGLIIQAVLALIISTALLFNAEVIGNFYLETNEYIWCIRIVALNLFPAVLVRFSQNLLKWTFKRLGFMVISIGVPMSTVSLTYIFIVQLDLGIIGVFYAQIISNVIFGIIGLIYCRYHFLVPRDLKYVRKLLGFGWPYMLQPFFVFLLPMYERIIITKYLSLELLGVYAVANKISSLIRLPIGGFQTAWGPYVFSSFKEKNINTIYDSILIYYSIIIMTIIIIIVGMLKPLITLFASAKYLNTEVYIIPLLMAVFIESLSWITGIGIGLAKKTYYSALAYFFSLIFGALFIYIGVKQWELAGIVTAVLLSKIILTALISYWGRSVYGLKFSYGKIIKILIIGVAFLVMFNYYWVPPFLYSLLVLVSTLLFLGVNWILILDSEERCEIKNAIQKKIFTRGVRKK